ncbi:MAG: hypothetical protein ACR2ND_09245 [Solirubrobacteraceae bacterium]
MRERRRERNGVLCEVDVTRLRPLDDLAEAGARCGFAVREASRWIPATEDHVGSEVVVLHAV